MKNIFFKVAVVVTVLALVTSCFVGGTLARYISTSTVSDSAVVARWGVEITSSGNLFNAAYGDKVVSTSQADLVAPGTSGSLAAISLSGTPEVAARITYSADLTLTGWTTDSCVYCPITITVGGTSYTCNGDLAAFKSAVEDAISAYTAEFKPNDNLATYTAAPSVSWAWAIGGPNANDTALGEQAAAGQPSSIALTIVTTVTQID